IASVCLEASLLQIGGAILREVPAFSEPSVAHLREDNIVVERLNELKFVEE
ncbi:MAG: septum site-determining protein MinC, partial [Thermotogae bacterium]